MSRSPFTPLLSQFSVVKPIIIIIIIIWMPKLARALRTQEDCLQVVAARVKKEVHDNLDDVLQQCESVDRLNTGPLYLK